MQADADWAANERVSHLWRVRLDGTGTVQLTSGKDGASPAKVVAGRAVGRVCRQAGRRGRRADPAAADDRGRGARADRARHGGRAARPGLPMAGSSTSWPRTPSRPSSWPVRKPGDDVYAFDENFQPRHLWRVDMATRAEIARHVGRLFGTELRAVGRRAAYRAPPRAQHRARRRRARRGLGDGRRRRQCRSADEEHRGRERRQPVAGWQRSSCSCRGSNEAVRDLLQRQHCS